MDAARFPGKIPFGSEVLRELDFEYLVQILGRHFAAFGIEDVEIWTNQRDLVVLEMDLLEPRHEAAHRGLLGALVGSGYIWSERFHRSKKSLAAVFYPTRKVGKRWRIVWKCFFSLRRRFYPANGDWDYEGLVESLWYDPRLIRVGLGKEEMD